MPVRLAGGIGILCLLEWFSAVPADYIDLAHCQDNSTATGADIFDTAVNGFLTASPGATPNWQAAGTNTGLTQGFLDLRLCLRGQCCYRPAVFLVLLNFQIMGFGGGLKLHVVIIAIVGEIILCPFLLLLFSARPLTK